MKTRKKIFSGDSIIEVTLGITIFSLVAVTGMAIMNRGLNQAQRALEITMARNEIDAQAEALRFIHNNYVAERQLSEDRRNYTDLWEKIVATAINPNEIGSSITTSDIDNATSCDAVYSDQFGAGLSPFIINTRFVQPSSILTGSGASNKYKNKVVPEIIAVYPSANEWNEEVGVFKTASTYPRLIFTTLNITDTVIDDGAMGGNTSLGDTEDSLSENQGTISGGESQKNYYRKMARAEGIWIIGVEGGKANTSDSAQFYDFYIRTCWNAAGMKNQSTITTTVRLYNPGVVE